ncbi:MAG: hypothetical protein ACXW3N_05880 [Rhodoplanes sp.]
MRFNLATKQPHAEIAGHEVQPQSARSERQRNIREVDVADPNTGNIQQTVNERSFGTRGSWSAGFDKAKVDDDGVVVGPDPATVFARFIAVNPGDHYRIAARAVSADHKRAIGTIQVNWFDKQNTLIYSTISKFELGNAEKKHSIVVKAPSRAAYGTLYVAPGRPNESVRYREMSISPVNFYTDFYKYTELQVEFFFGIIASALAFIALAILARRMLPARANAIFSGIIDVLHRRFYIFSVILIPSLLLFLEQQYEMDFDSHWHQNWIERIIRWSDVAIDVGPGILHNFGI